MTTKKLFQLLALAICLCSQAQESHYWFHNFGALSSLRGGIESASVRNVSAVYYNPAALAFIDGTFLEGTADVFQLDAINISNAGGENIDLNFFTVNIQPSMVAFMRKVKKNPKFTYSLGGIARYDFNNGFLLNHEQEGNYVNPPDSDDVYQGQFRYNNRTRENWVMAGFGYRASQKVGLGLSVNAFIRTTDFATSYNAIAFPIDELDNDPEVFELLTSQSDYQRFDARSLGFIFKPSIALDFGDLKMGMVITTPAINLGLLNNFTERAQQSIRPDVDPELISISDSKQFYSGVYRTPLSINMGFHYDFGKVNLGLAAEWFSKVKRYQMIKRNDRSTDLQFPPSSDPNFAIPEMAHRSIVNFGLTVEVDIKETLSYVGSLRTDFSYYDQRALNSGTDFVPLAATWDIFHITSGIKYTGPRTDLTLGLNYGYGRQDDYLQFVDMTSPTQDNFLRGNPQNTAQAIYNNLAITLGFNFDIDFKKGLETDDI